jgi:hypothetical protein
MSQRSARYQQQITGRPITECYKVRGVCFDGGDLKLLLEAKGRGYANKFLDNLEPRPWFKKGAEKLVDQAQRQILAANGTPIHWHVAEEKAAKAIAKLLRDANTRGIKVIHTPAMP